LTHSCTAASNRLQLGIQAAVRFQDAAAAEAELVAVLEAGETTREDAATARAEAQVSRAY
jgi:hypothetical protein